MYTGYWECNSSNAMKRNCWYEMGLINHRYPMRALLSVLYGACQTCNALLLEAEAISWPSGDHATASTPHITPLVGGY
jgi:hypothetical protein